MAQLWDGVVEFYNHTMENGDPRVQEWPLMQSPLPTISICVSYVYVVKFLGPTLMKNREPVNIRTLMVLYNFAMVGVSMYMFLQLGFYGWFGKYNYKCQPVDYSDSREAIGMAHLAWWYYISKFVEFTDTVFFVLRKKFSHVSTLHVIHHGVMPMSVWWGVKFTPGGHSTFFAFVNSFVHILMYIYYGLSAVGPSMYKYLWWKKYMTTIQMVQFIMIMVHSFQLLFRNCNYPHGFMWWIGFHAILFWFLFWDFYKNAYRKPKRGAFTVVTTKKADAPNGIVSNGTAKLGGMTNGYVSSGKNGYTNGYIQNGYGHGNAHVNHETTTLTDTEKKTSSKLEKED